MVCSPTGLVCQTHGIFVIIVLPVRFNLVYDEAHRLIDRIERVMPFNWLRVGDSCTIAGEVDELCVGVYLVALVTKHRENGIRPL